MSAIAQYLPGMENERRNLELSQWHTPPETAARIAEFALRNAGLKRDGLRVLEPSCGHGAIVKALITRTRWKVSVIGVDIDPRCVAHCEQAFDAYRHAFMAANFLELEPRALGPEFDLCVANPPFEDGQAEEHILHALKFAPRVVFHVPLKTLEGQDRKVELWGRVDLKEMAVCSARPKYSAEGGKTAMMTVKIERAHAQRGRPRPRNVRIEWW